MKNKAPIFSILVSILLLSFHNNATAQIGNPYLIYRGAFNNAMFLNTKGAIERGMRNRDAKTSEHTVSKASPAKAADLNFTPSPAVHDRVVQSIAKLMANGDATKIASNTNILNKANLLGEFNGLLGKYGFNSHNLADVFSAYVILSWQSATGGDATKSPRGIESFRQTVQASFIANESVSTFSNAQKQEVSETIAYMAVLVTLANQEVVKRGDPAAIANSHQKMGELTLKATGIDVAKYNLTQQGLVLK
jgi:hypothetical protein